MGLVDRLVLLLAWIATCGLVYLLGFYVGKGTQERRLGLEDRIVRLPVSSQPPPEGGRQKSETEFGFYDKLMGERGAVPAVVPPRVAAAPAGSGEARGTTPPAAPAPAHASAASSAQPPARVAAAPAGPPVATPSLPRAATPAAPPAPPAKPPAPVPAAARPAPVALPVPEKVAPTPPQPAALPATPPPAAVPAAQHAAVPAAPPAAGGWTVLANPTRSREEAEGLERQLRGRGYDAALVRVLRDGETWYRVQIGRFATAEQASEVMRRLREHEGVAHVFVASE
jgi:cell division septation protein DedD